VFFSAFADMFARKMTVSSVKHVSINTPPEFEKETIDEFKKTMKDAGDILINKNHSMVVDHLMTLTLIHYINIVTENKNLCSDYKSIYKISLNAIVVDMTAAGHLRVMTTVMTLTTTSDPPRSLVPPRKHR
jgi:hypothetical protein